MGEDSHVEILLAKTGEERAVKNMKNIFNLLSKVSTSLTDILCRGI